MYGNSLIYAMIKYQLCWKAIQQDSELCDVSNYHRTKLTNVQ
jgi:hypothetical protein